jgi:hypothetical protein
MHISTEKEIDGAAARRLRGEMSQRAFWQAVHVPQPVGCRYEAGRRIPTAVRVLLFLRYVAGLTIDASTPEGVAEIMRLAKLQAGRKAKTH